MYSLSDEHVVAIDKETGALTACVQRFGVLHMVHYHVSLAEPDATMRDLLMFAVESEGELWHMQETTLAVATWLLSN